MAQYAGAPWIRNLGRVEPDVKLAALSAADAMAMPSHGEAFGVTYLESWLAGRPVIGLAKGAVQALVADGKDGFLVPPGDDAALTRLCAATWRTQRVAEMGAAGRQKVLEQYTLDRIVDRIEGACLRLVEARGGAMRVSLLNLNLVSKDAIGRSIMAQARCFQRRGDIVQIFVEQPPEDVPADIARLCHVVTPAALRRDPEGRFAATDLYIYHYGGRHGLMDSISTIDGGMVCFYYHNVTPPDLWNWEEDKAALRRGIAGVRLAAQADFVIGDSEYNLRQLAHISGVSEDRLHAVPLPVDISAFRPGPPLADLRRRYKLGDAPVLLYVGRMAPNKRVDLLVDLLAAVRQHSQHPHPDARLLLVGDYDSAPAYRLVTEQVQAVPRARRDISDHHGPVDPADYYRLGAVYVTTSQHEGFCLPSSRRWRAVCPSWPRGRSHPGHRGRCRHPRRAAHGRGGCGRRFLLGR